MSRRACAASLAVALLLVLVMPVMAQTTSRQMIHMEGRAYDQASPPNPLSGSYAMTFRIYDVSSGGTALFTETHNSVSFNNGFYEAKLGEQTSGGIPASVFANNDLYLEIQIGTETLSPRVRLASEAFAFNADMLDGSHASAFAAATGATGYIQNQTSSPQTGGFNISGNALIGGNVGIGTSSPAKLLHMYKDQNSGTAIFVENPNTGTAAHSSVVVGETVSSLPFTGIFMTYYCSGYTTSGLRMADTGAVFSGYGCAGGLSLGTDNANAPLRFFTGGLGGGTSNVRMYITSSGDIGIGNTSPSYKVDITGGLRASGADIYLTGLSTGTPSTTLRLTAGNQVVVDTSSRKHKHDILDYKTDMAKIDTLRPVTFKWNDDTATPNSPDFGLIAEEVQELFPEIVGKNADGEAQSVDYAKLSVILLKAVQEQRKENAELLKRIEQIEAKAAK
jgi:hypothetical protein